MAWVQVYEFLFRGRVTENGVTRGNTYHVILEDEAGKYSDAMSPAQAAKEGWPLPAIEADLVRQLSASLDETSGKLAQVEKERDKIAGEKATIEKVANAMAAQLGVADAAALAPTKGKAKK